MSGAGSPGQQVWIGSAVRSTSSPLSTTSWQGAFETVLGFIAITVLSSGNISKASRQPPGGSGCFSQASCSPRARNSPGSRPMPQATRSTVPKRLTRTFMSQRRDPSRTFSNRTAGPSSARSRVWISVISRTGETGSRTRVRRPADSSRAMKSRSER